MRRGDIRLSGHRREPVFGRGTAQDRRVRVAVQWRGAVQGAVWPVLIVAGPRSRAGFAAGGPGFQMRVRSRSSRRLAACLACSTSPPGTGRKPKPALTLPPGAKSLAARARRPCP
jgi:hypothetical protein